jgi:hypothetical protein
MLRQLSEIEFLFKGLAEETAVTVNDDNIEGMLAVTGAFDHLLEGRPPIIAGGCAGLDEFGSYRMAVCAAPRRQLAALIRN